MNAIELAATLCRRFEGFYPRPYLCPAGVPTIGYGATYYETGVAVTLQDPPITRERAEELLMWMLRTKYAAAVRRQCPVIDGGSRVAAIIDFAFNLGEGALSASTLRRRINAERWDAVPTELRRWVYAGSTRLQGLVSRREAEVALV